MAKYVLKHDLYGTGSLGSGVDISSYREFFTGGINEHRISARFLYTASNHSNATFYYELVINSDGTDSVYSALFNQSGTKLTDSEVSTTSASLTRIRSASITLTDGDEYHAEIKTSGEINSSLEIDNPRILEFIDDTGLSNIEEQITLASAETISGQGSPQIIDDDFHDIFYYDSANWQDDTDFYFEVEMAAATGDTAYADLYNKDDSSSVDSVSTTSETFVRLTTATLSLTNQKNHVVRIGDNSGGQTKLRIAKVLAVISNVNIFESHHAFLCNDYIGIQFTSYVGLAGVRLSWDPDEWNALKAVYFQSIMKAEAGETMYQVIGYWTESSSVIISATEISTTNSSEPTRVRSADIQSDMPSTSKSLRSAFKVSGGTDGATYSNGTLVLVTEEYKLPTNSVNAHWTNPDNAHLRDGNYANSNSAGDYQRYNNFNFNIPSSATIDGIEVRIKGHAADLDSSTMSIGLSHNNGSNYTSSKSDTFNLGSDQTKVYGGATDTWGRTWSDTEFSNANFQLRALQADGGRTIDVDYIEVKVFYTEASGTTDISITDTGSGLEDETAGNFITLTDGMSFAGFTYPVTYPATADKDVETISVALNNIIEETGTGTESIAAQVFLTLSENGTAAEIIQAINRLTETESGLGADQLDLTVEMTIVDEGTGASDLDITNSLVMPETGAGASVLSIINSFALQETGAGADTVSEHIRITITEAGSTHDHLGYTYPVTYPISSASGEQIDVVIAVNLNDPMMSAELANIAAGVVINENVSSTEILQAMISLSEVDSGVASEVVGLIATALLTDSVVSTEDMEIQAVLKAVDSGSGVEVLDVLANIAVNDAVAGTDALNLLARIALGEEGSGVEVEAIAININETDSGSGAESEGIQAGVDLEDTGLATAALDVLAEIALEDSLVAIDAVSVIQESLTLSLSDSGTGTDAVDNLVMIAASDSGAAIEALSVLVNFALSDSAVASEIINQTISLTVNDVVTATEALTILAALDLSETAAASDEITTLGLALLTDDVTGVDSVALMVALALVESGTAGDAVDILASVLQTDSGTAETLLEVLAQIGMEDTGTGADALSIIFDVQTITVTDSALGQATLKLVELIGTSESKTALSLLQSGVRLKGKGNSVLGLVQSYANLKTKQGKTSLNDTKRGTTTLKMK